MPRIKICCIAGIDEARLAIEHGANAIGLVGPMPSGPGVIENEKIPLIARSVPPGVSTFLLTSERSPEGIISHCRMAQTNTVQLVDEPEPGTYQRIRETLPYLKIVQVIHVIDQSSVTDAIRISPFVDALLLDSGNPRLLVKELGGTGRVHDWSLSRQIRDHANVPVFLAGGLNPENVGEAILRVAPFGVDVCSGVRTKGALDRDKLFRFVKNARPMK